MTDQIIVVANDWALASDGIQWILQRRQGGKWRAVSFVRSTRDILARCMREKDVEAVHSALLLSGLATETERRAVQAAEVAKAKAAKEAKAKAAEERKAAKSQPIVVGDRVNNCNAGAGTVTAIEPDTSSSLGVTACASTQSLRETNIRSRRTNIMSGRNISNA